MILHGTETETTITGATPAVEAWQIVKNMLFLFFFLFLAQQPNVGQGRLFLEVSRSHTQWHSTVGWTPLDEGSAHRRDLYLTTQQSQETDIHAPDGIRTRNSSRRPAIDPRLRPLGHCDWQTRSLHDYNQNQICCHTFMQPDLFGPKTGLKPIRGIWASPSSIIIVAFWDVKSCSVVDECQCCGGTCCLYLQNTWRP